MSRITVNPAVESQAAVICDVLRRSIEEVCGPDYNNDEAILSEWLSNKTVDNVAAWIVDPATLSVVAMCSSETVGFAHASSSEIYLNYVLPDFLGQGAGFKMLSALEAWARSCGSEELGCSSTITALSFYERQGYSRSGEPEYVGGILGEFPLSKHLGI